MNEYIQIQDARDRYILEAGQLYSEAEKDVGYFDSHELNPVFQQFGITID